MDDFVLAVIYQSFSDGLQSKLSFVDFEQDLKFSSAECVAFVIL